MSIYGQTTGCADCGQLITAERPTFSTSPDPTWHGAGDDASVRCEATDTWHRPRTRLCRDESCPECDFPETYAEIDPEASTPGADAIGCNKCGWRIEAVSA